MTILQKKVKLTRNPFSIRIPRQFLNKEAEITIRTDDSIADEMLLSNDISIDTKKWKFNREEIYNNGK